MTYIQGEPRVLGLGWLFHCVPECAWADGSLAEWTEQLVKTGGTSKVDPIQVSEVIVYPVYSGGRGTFINGFSFSCCSPLSLSLFPSLHFPAKMILLPAALMQ